MYPEQDNQPDFSFIMGSQQSKPGKFGGGGGKTHRIVVVVVALIALLIGGIIFMNIVSSGSRAGRAELIDLAAYQSELGRVAAIGTEQGDSAEVRARAAIVSFSLTTDLLSTRKLMSSVGADPSAEDLAKYRSTSLDTQFETAQKANNFDAVYSSVLTEKLNNYKVKIVEVFNTQTNNTVKEKLREFKAHADTLSPDAPTS